MKKGDIVKRVLKYKPIKGTRIEGEGFQVELLEEKDWIYYDSIVEDVYENCFSTIYGESVDFNDDSIVLK